MNTTPSLRLVCLLLVFFISCEPDRVQDEIAAQEEAFYTSELSEEDIRAYKALYGAVTDFNKQRAAAGKVEIDLHYAVEIYYNGTRSYTFGLTNPDSELLYNIVFSEQDGVIQPDYISYYYYTETGEMVGYAIPIIPGDRRPLTAYSSKEKGDSEEPVEGTPTYYDDDPLDTIFLEDNSTSGGSSPGGGSGNYYVPSSPSYGGGGGSTGDYGSGSPQPHGGGGSKGGATTPIAPLYSPEESCSNLKYQFNASPYSTKFKEKILDLKNKTGRDYESGYSMDKDGKFTKLKRDGDHSLTFNPKQGDIGFLHTHPTTPMFSPADFFKFKMMLNSAAHTSGQKVEDVYGIVMHGSNNYYMLKFDGDYKQLVQHFNKNTLTEKGYKDKYKDIHDRYQGNLEMTFIKFVEDIVLDSNTTFKNSGFHLYKIELNSNGNLKKATEKYLKTKNKLDSKKC